MKSLIELLVHFAFRIFHINMSAKIIEEDEPEEEKESEFSEIHPLFYFSSKNS